MSDFCHLRFFVALPYRVFLTAVFALIWPSEHCLLFPFSYVIDLWDEVGWTGMSRDEAG